MYPVNKLSGRVNAGMVLLLDANDETRSRIVRDRLSNLVKHFQTFSSTSDCIDYIRQLSEVAKVIIISVNEADTKPIIAVIDDLKQIAALYIIDDANDHREKRIRRFNDVSLLFEHVETTAVNMKNQSFSFCFLNQEQRSTLDLTKEAATFMWGQLTLDVLQELPANSNGLDDMVASCTDFYHYDDFELLYIDEFRRTYRAEEAVKWYSRSCFLFRLVNMVLRMEDVNGLFVFRQFIIDLRTQIVKEYHQQRRSISSRRVYHGQRLPIAELERMKIATDNLISVNSFLSTSTDRHVAELFIENGQVETQIQALFIIDVDMNLESTVCADISALSMMHDECEVLFSLSSVFRLKNVHHNKERDLWEIYLVATDEGRESLNDYKRMMSETIQETNPYLLFVQLLFNRGLYEKANIYYNSLVKLIPVHDLATHTSLNILYGRCLLLASKYEESLSILTKVLATFQEINQGFESPEYLRCQFNIANIYVYTNKYELALNLYRQILISRRKTLPSNHYGIAESLSGISWALGLMGNSEEALEYAIQSLSIRQRILPACHPTIAHALVAIGSSYESQGRWLEAQDYFCQAHDLTTRYLPKTHVRYAFSLSHLGLMSENRGEYDTALSYYSEALQIYECNFKHGHPSTAHTLMLLGNVHRRRNQYEQAFECLNKVLDMQNNILTPSHLSFAATFQSLGNIYLDTKDNLKAIDYFMKALEIKKKHLNWTNPTIPCILSCLGTAYSHTGQLELAKATFEEVLQMQQTIYPRGHPNIGVTMHHMASNYCRMNDSDKALELYQKSLGINEQYFPPNHIEITSVKSKIERLVGEEMKLSATV